MMTFGQLQQIHFLTIDRLQIKLITASNSTTDSNDINKNQPVQASRFCLS